MSREDAETVQRHLENAEKAAAPLKDGQLVKKIQEAQEHVTKKLDHKKGGG